MKKYFLIGTVLTVFLLSLSICFGAGGGTFLYTVIDAHTGEDMSNKGVAVYAKKTGTREWNYIGVYTKAYAGKGNINVTHGQNIPCSRDNHLIFPDEERFPNLDIKFVCENYRDLIVKNRSNRVHSSKNIFAMQRFNR